MWYVACMNKNLYPKLAKEGMKIYYSKTNNMNWVVQIMSEEKNEFPLRFYSTDDCIAYFRECNFTEDEIDDLYFHYLEDKK